jgi:hypothetical protein
LVNAKTVTVAERAKREAAGAVFDFTANFGWLPDQRAENGGVIGGRKKGEDRQPDSSKIKNAA